MKNATRPIASSSKVRHSIDGVGMSIKLRVLAWSDWVLAPTGFGTVARHVLGALHETGRYQIDQLAINYHGDFYDQDECPYRLSPAKLLDPSDPHGRKQLLRMLEGGDYDILWVLNDLNVLQPIIGNLQRLKEQKRVTGRKMFDTVLYYPVDCNVRVDMCDVLRFADVTATYTQWARLKTLESFPDLKDVRVIGHGADARTYYPLPKHERQLLRSQYLRVDSPSTFVLVNVNRNLPRKDLARTILAYREFRKSVSDTVLYLHCPIREWDIDLGASCQFLGLQVGKDVLFPAAATWTNGGGLPPDELNKIYNCADAYLTTTLGEGWGLTITDAMSSGLPIIAPQNSSIPEILGDDGDRGYVYTCMELVRIDNYGYRPMGRLENIVEKVKECYEQRGTARQGQILARAATFVEQHTWGGVGKHWQDLFARLTKDFWKGSDV